MYYQKIFVDPKDAERIYSMDVFLKVSDDAGKTWRNLGERYKHVDNHAIWIDPDDTDHYLVGCDGGLYESFDRAATWHFFGNLPVTQFYRVDVDNSLARSTTSTAAPRTTTPSAAPRARSPSTAP